MKLSTILFCAGLLMISVGCAGTQPRVMVMDKTYAPTAAESIQIFAASKPTRPYVEIGQITIPGSNRLIYVPIVNAFAGQRSGEDVSHLLKQKAAELGADAVIITSDIDGSTTGVAIKYKDD